MDDTKTVHELRQRIAGYGRLRCMMTDRRALEALDSLIEEVEERIRLHQRLLEEAAQIECDYDHERNQ